MYLFHTSIHRLMQCISQNKHDTQGRLVGTMVSYRLLTNDRCLDWLASGGTRHDETTELSLEKTRVKHVSVFPI